MTSQVMEQHPPAGRGRPGCRAPALGLTARGDLTPNDYPYGPFGSEQRNQYVDYSHAVISALL